MSECLERRGLNVNQDQVKAGGSKCDKVIAPTTPSCENSSSFALLLCIWPSVVGAELVCTLRLGTCAGQTAHLFHR